MALKIQIIVTQIIITFYAIGKIIFAGKLLTYFLWQNIKLQFARFFTERFCKEGTSKIQLVVLDYPFFKNDWEIEVPPNCLPKLAELNNLKSAIPASAKDRLYETGTLEKAWVILDRPYGQHFDICNKFKLDCLVSLFLQRLSHISK